MYNSYVNANRHILGCYVRAINGAYGYITETQGPLAILDTGKAFYISQLRFVDTNEELLTYDEYTSKYWTPRPYWSPEKPGKILFSCQCMC